MASILPLTSELTHLTLKLRAIANGELYCLVYGGYSSLVPKLEVFTLDVGASYECITLENEPTETNTRYMYVLPILDIIQSRCSSPHEVQTLKGGVKFLRDLRFLSPKHRRHRTLLLD